jgi:hypothetical protein
MPVDATAIDDLFDKLAFLTVGQEKIDRLLQVKAERTNGKKEYVAIGWLAQKIQEAHLCPASRIKTKGMVLSKLARAPLDSELRFLRRTVPYETDPIKKVEKEAKIAAIEEQASKMGRPKDATLALITKHLLRGLITLGIEPSSEILLKPAGKECPHGLAEIAFTICNSPIGEKPDGLSKYIQRALADSQVSKSESDTLN